MKEFKDLLNTAVLTEESRKQIAEAFDAKVKAIEESVRSDLEVKFAQKFVTEKTDLATKMFAMIDEAVSHEIEELRQDIKASKNLEVTYAQKLQAFKEHYAKTLDAKFDSVLAESVKAEFEGLRADLLEARKLNIGKKIIEAVKDEMLALGLFEETKDIKSKLDETEKALTEAKTELVNTKREALVEKLLSGLSGTSREVMATILEHVPYEKVETRFNETVEAVVQQKAGTTIAPAAPAGGTTTIVEGAENSEIARVRQLSGIKTK